MLDRSIGVAGLSLALLFGVLQYYLPQFPPWAAYAGVLGGVFLLGMSAALLLAHRGQCKTTKPVKTALLRLHIHADQRMPELLQSENVFRWFFLRQAIATTTPDGAHSTVFPITTVFVTFEPEVVISTFRVRSPNLQLPSHEVKEFNQRFAIIVFGGELGDGTLELVRRSGIIRRT